MGDSRKQRMKSGGRTGKLPEMNAGQFPANFLENSAGQGRFAKKMIASSWRQSVLWALIFLLGIAGFAGDGRRASLWLLRAKNAPIRRPKKNKCHKFESVTADTYCCYRQG